MAFFNDSRKTLRRQSNRGFGKLWNISLKAVGVFMLLCAIAMPSTSAKDYKWILGRLVSAEIAGHGPQTDTKKTETASIGSDIWWAYRISAGNLSHLAVTRESPSRIGIELGSPVRFAISNKSILIRDSSKVLHNLKIVRTSTAKDWP